MFKRNDVVLCIDTRPDEQGIVPFNIKEGESYKVDDISVCGCAIRLSLINIPDRIPSYAVCASCRQSCFGFYSWRFIKLSGEDIVVENENLSDVKIDILLEA